MSLNVPVNVQVQNARQASTRLQSEMQDALNTLRINIGGSNARAFSSLSQPLGRLTGQADDFTKSLDAANARVLAFGASVGIFNAVSNSLKALVRNTIEVEKAITEITVVGEQFNGKTKELSQGIFSIAKATGQSFDAAAKAALEFSRQGLGLEDTLQRTKDALILTRTTGLDAAKSVEGLSAAVSAFASAGLSASQVLNKLAAVDQSFKVSSADLIQAFERTGAAAQQAGVTFDELAGIVTSLQANTSRGGAVIGNSLKTIFTRLGEVDKLEKLKNVGVVVEDLSGQILPATKILQNLANDVQGFGKLTQSGIFKDIAGTFQINQLISLIDDLAKKNSIASQATEKSANATNEAYIANEKLNQSLDAILNKVATTGKQLGSLLGELGLTDNLKGLLDGINSFLEGANNLLQGDTIGSNFAQGIVKGIGSVLSGPGLAIFGAIIGKLLLDFAKFSTQGFKTFFGIGKAAAEQKQVQESIVQVLLKNEAIARSINSVQGGQNAKGLEFLRILNEQAEAMQFIEQAAAQIAPSVYGGGYRSTSAGLQKKPSTGLVPNFAADALQQAVAREKKAGLSDSQIYIDQNPSLKSASNPMGLMVANTRDEPLGGAQGISRARKEGIDPKTYGSKPSAKSGGFVPNYSGSALDYVPNYAKRKKRANYGRSSRGKTFPITPEELGAPSAETFAPDVVSDSTIEEVQAPNVEVVNKSFADVAGKLFLLQSAVSFATGAFKDTENSLAKFAQEAASAGSSLTSLAFLGQQIKQTDPATAFGKFAKVLGLAGIGVAAAIEGFKLFDFAIKEFSGANKRAADALAGLETAAQGALVSLNDLTPTGQRTAQETGKAALESFSGSFISNLFSEAAGKNPEIQKQVGLLSAQGIKPETLKSLIENEALDVTAKKLGFENSEEYFAERKRSGDVSPMLEQEVRLTSLSEAISNLFKNTQVLNAGKALSTVREKFKGGEFNKDTSLAQILKAVPEAKQIDPKILQSVIDANQLTLSTKKAIVEEERNQALGERITIELAKQKLDNLIEQKKNAIDLNTISGTEGLRFQLQALDLSESYKNELEKQIKLKEIDGELSKKNIDLVKSSIDKLSSLPSESVLGVSAQQIAELQNQLGDLNISTVNELDSAITKIGEKLELTPEQIARINALYAEQFKQLKGNADAEKAAAINAADFNKRVIDTKNSLQAARLLTEQIASDLERAAKIRLSFAEVGISATENRAKLLRSQAGFETTNVGKRSRESEAIAAEQLANEQKRLSSEDLYNSDKKRLELLKNQAQADLLRKSAEFSQGKITLQQLTETGNAFKKADQDLIELNNSQEIARQNFALTSQELQIQAAAIYKVIGASDALKNSLDQFKLGAGERIAGSQLDMLGATDINSFAQAQIKTNVETGLQGKGLSDQDYYKSLQEQTRLRQIQFDLSTAESATRKRELEYELKYTQELIDLKNRGASEQEIIDAKNRQIAEQRSGTRGFEKGLDTIQDRINNYRSTLGEEIPNLFSSNLAQGLNDAISGAKDLKTALADAATSFFQAITQKNIANLADLVTSGFGSFSKSSSSGSSGLFGFASGGMIKGGSGTKDDVPAMLMGGEYVVKKSAVSKYGKGFLDSLNNGSVRGYATGGIVDPQTFSTQTGRGGFFTPGDYGQGAITGKNELLAFATQTNTGGRYDYMGGFGMNGATVSLEPESARLSATGRENSPMFERIQQSKDEAFRVYLEGLQKEKEYADLIDQIAKDKKARKKQLQTAIISAVVSSAASYAGSSIKAGVLNNRGSSTQQTAFAEFLQKNPQYLKMPSQTYTFKNGQYRASGGLISGGSNIRDDVPAMLTGGEFVLNNRATQRIGLQNLTKLNNGQTTDSGASSIDMTQALISKLDELIQATQNSSSDNVVVNVSTSEAGGQSQDNAAGTEKELGKKIKQAVLDVIAQEKRLGGSLEKAR